ncbi:MAG: hypothetical protein J6C79_03080 [Clostridia bacterium]|nr:hypothetical protein [Clostridia bacterium]
MKDSTQNRKKKLLALFLSAMMAISVASLAACKGGNGGTSSESSSEEEKTETTVTDKGPIKNAGFEVFDTNDGLNVIGMTVSNWSRSLFSDGTNSAPSSKADSGILDTSDDAWNNLTGSYYVDNGEAADVAAADKLIEALSEEDAIALWDNFTTRDKLKYYEVWKDANKDGKISEDFDEYESFNGGSLALVDVPDTANPGTHHSAADKAAEGFSDHNVLMIHNKNPETDEGEKVIQSIGSAQKYTSSSTVTVQAGAAAEISVWVKTQDLMSSSSDGTAQEAVDKGAYITLSQTVGGASMPAYEVKNINTEYMGLEDTNGWKQYTFYVKGSSYASTTLTLTLGLGQGTSNSRTELVNGYAFFDDIQCNIFSQEEFAGKVNAHPTANVVQAAKFEDPKALKTIDVSKEYNANAYANAETLGYVAGQGFDVFPIDFYGEFSNADGVLNSISHFATKSEDGYTSMTGNNTMPTLQGGRNGNADVIKVFDNIAAIGNYTPDSGDADGADKKSFVDAVYANYLTDVEYPGANHKVLLMMSARGVAYTAKSDYTFAFNSDVEYMAVSFFVRTSDMNGFTGAGVTLIDGRNKTSFDAIDTTDITPVNIGTEGTDSYKEDIYEGWQQYIFFVKNDSDDVNASFKLQFNFGPTTIDETSSINSFQTGFAAFTNFQTLEMSAEEYESATSGTYAKLVTVTGEEDVTAAGNSGFDTAGNKSATHTSIEKGIALAQNYKGVYSDSDYVTDKFNENTAINTYTNAGLLNRTYFTGAKGEESYYTTTNAPAWMAGITTIAQQKNSAVDTTNATAVWNAAFGDATQPLFIWNDGTDTTNSYGFIGNSTSIAANTYTAISMRVKVGSTDTNAAAPSAHIYLIDTSDDTRTNVLSIGAKTTYWYDKKGDVYTGDPTERSSEKAFILQANGLYIANTKWSGYDAATMAGKYFANLNAYTDLDANNNKLVAKNGGVHDYVGAEEYVKVSGEKRAIAFYHKDGAYYADKACTLPVSDFSATGVATRTGAAASKALHAKVAATDDWVTVTFYIHTGSTAKNYRLEIWSGERTGNPNAAGTYVMLDGNPSPASNAETYYNNLLGVYEDDDTIEQYKSVFSYFDTDKFLRYNEDLDTDEIGNLYEENYDVTAQKEATFYLYAGAENENQNFLVNYATQDQVVTASASDKDDTTTDNPDETAPTTQGTNPLLLISSIVIAVALVLAIASIIFRKIWKKARKNILSKKRKPKKEKSKRVKIAKVETEEPKEEIDEDSPYND